MSLLKKTVAILSILVAALGATACSSDAQAKGWASELERAGFTDPVIVSDDHKVIILMATAGDCRLRFVGGKEPSRLYATIPGAPMGDEGSFIGDPSLPLIKADKRFAGCFSEEKQG